MLPLVSLALLCSAPLAISQNRGHQDGSKASSDEQNPPTTISELGSVGNGVKRKRSIRQRSIVAEITDKGQAEVQFADRGAFRNSLRSSWGLAHAKPDNVETLVAARARASAKASRRRALDLTIGQKRLIRPRIALTEIMNEDEAAVRLAEKLSVVADVDNNSTARFSDSQRRQSMKLSRAGESVDKAPTAPAPSPVPQEKRKMWPVLMPVVIILASIALLLGMGIGGQALWRQRNLRMREAERAHDAERSLDMDAIETCPELLSPRQRFRAMAEVRLGSPGSARQGDEDRSGHNSDDSVARDLSRFGMSTPIDADGHDSIGLANAIDDPSGFACIQADVDEQKLLAERQCNGGCPPRRLSKPAAGSPEKTDQLSPKSRRPRRPRSKNPPLKLGRSPDGSNPAEMSARSRSSSSAAEGHLRTPAPGRSRLKTPRQNDNTSPNSNRAGSPRSPKALNPGARTPSPRRGAR